MLGFLIGIAVNILLGQLPVVLGVQASDRVAATKALDALIHPAEIQPAALATGVGALALQFGRPLGRRSSR
jgi:sulfate permease, SulP family